MRPTPQPHRNLKKLKHCNISYWSTIGILNNAVPTVKVEFCRIVREDDHDLTGGFVELQTEHCALNWGVTRSSFKPGTSRIQTLTHDITLAASFIMADGCAISFFRNYRMHFYRIVKLRVQGTLVRVTTWRHVGNGVIAPLIHDLGTRWKSVINFKPRPLYTRGNNPGTHVNGGWVAPEPVWMFWKKR